MNFNLSEEQSLDVYAHLTSHVPLIEHIRKSGINMISTWYKTYSDNFVPGLFFNRKLLPMDIWFNKITKIYLDEEENVLMGLPDGNIYKKLKKIVPDIQAKDVIFVACAAAACNYTNPHYSSFISDVVELADLLKEYGNVPYTMNTEELMMYKDVKERNMEMVTTLNLIGEEYDI